MRIRSLLIGAALIAACNKGSLTPVAAPSSPPSTPVQVTPPPTPTAGPTPAVGASDCGNADYAVFDANDPDDPPGQADAWECIWLCTADALDPQPPHEVLYEYDFDTGYSPELMWGPVFLPCGVYIP